MNTRCSRYFFPRNPLKTFLFCIGYFSFPSVLPSFRITLFLWHSRHLEWCNNNDGLMVRGKVFRFTTVWMHKNPIYGFVVVCPHTMSLLAFVGVFIKSNSAKQLIWINKKSGQSGLLVQHLLNNLTSLMQLFWPPALYHDVPGSYVSKFLSPSRPAHDTTFVFIPQRLKHWSWWKDEIRHMLYKRRLGSVRESSNLTWHNRNARCIGPWRIQIRDVSERG